MGITEMIVFSFALSLDLSVASFSLGMRVRNSKEISILALIIAILYGIITIAGFYLGSLIGNALGKASTYIGALILIITGISIIREYMEHPYRDLMYKNTLLIYLSASIENLLAGFSLGTFSSSIIGFVFIFVIISYFMNLYALKIGKLTRRYINFSTDLLMGVFLIMMGVLSFFNLI